MKIKQNVDLFTKLTSIYIENDNIEKEKIFKKLKEKQQIENKNKRDIIQKLNVNGRHYKKVLEYPKQSFAIEKKYKIFKQQPNQNNNLEEINSSYSHNFNNLNENEKLVDIEEVGNKIFKLNKKKNDFKKIRDINHVRSKIIINKVEYKENNNIAKIFDLSEIKTKLLKISFYRPSIKKNFSYLDKM